MGKRIVISKSLVLLIIAYLFISEINHGITEVAYSKSELALFVNSNSSQLLESNSSQTLKLSNNVSLKKHENCN